MRKLNTDLIAKPKNESVTIHEKGKTKNIVDEILGTFGISVDHLQRFAPELAGKDLHETLYNVWDFVRQNIKYKLDPAGVQWIKTPARTWADGFGDCKSYSIFIGAALHCLGIPFTFRFASYDGKELTHVYIVVKTKNKTYKVDSCLSEFDKEETYTIKKDYDMPVKIERLSGVGATMVEQSIISLGEMTPPTFDLICARRYYQELATGLLKHGRNNAVAFQDGINALSLATYIGDMLQAIKEKDNWLIDLLYYDFLNGGYVKTGNEQTDRDLRRAQIERINTLQVCRNNKEDSATIQGVLQNAVNAEPNAQTRNCLKMVIEGYCPLNGTIEGIGKWNLKDAIKNAGNAVTNFAKDVANKAADIAGDIWEGAKNAVGKVWEVIKRFNPLSGAIRAAYLLLIKTNVRGWATKMGWGQDATTPENKNTYEGLLEGWKKFGGDPNKLAKAIEHGKGKKPIFREDIRIEGVFGIGEPMTIGTAIALGGAAIAAIAPILALFVGKEPKEDESDETLQPFTLPDNVRNNDVVINPDNVRNVDDYNKGNNNNNNGGNGKDNTNTILLVGGGLGLLALIMSNKKSKRSK